MNRQWFLLARPHRVPRGLRGYAELEQYAQLEHGSLDAPDEIVSGRYAVVVFPNRRGEQVTYVLVGTVPREP